MIPDGLLALSASPGHADSAPPGVLIGAANFFALALLAGGLICLLRLLFSAQRDSELWRRGSDWLNYRPWHLGHLWLILLIVFLPQVITAMVISRIMGQEAFEAFLGTLPGVLSFGVPFQVLGILTVVVMTLRMRWNRGVAFGLDRSRNRPAIGFGLYFFLAALPLVGVVGWVFRQLFLHFEDLLKQLEISVESQEIFGMLHLGVSPWLIAGVFLLAVVGAPIFEELVFRGIALPALARRIGLTPAVIMTSLIFGLVHGNITAFAPLTVLAVFLCLVYIRTRSLLAPMILHGIFNGLSLSAHLLSQPVP